MMRRSLCLAVAALSFAAEPLAQPQPAAPATIVIVRHAEAMADAGSDPALTDAGRARAAALGDALKDSDVAAVFTTEYQRTMLTGEPIAAAVKAAQVKDTIGPGAAGLATYVRQLVQTVHAKYAGKTVVIVGHSNTVPAIVKAFSGVDPGAIAHDSYDQMFIVTTSVQGSGRLVRARYGARDSGSSLGGIKQANH